MPLSLLFLSGFTSAFNCVMLQMGLLASTVAAKGEKRALSAPIWATVAFLTSKLIAYTVLGFLLGMFGEAVSISDTIQSSLELAAGLYVVATALHLLNVHPIFRYTVIQPPRFFTKMIRSTSKSHALFAPALLGALTVLIPCGTTVAVEGLAVASANPFYGALVMGVFTAGTIPVFLGFGPVTALMSDALKERFFKIEGIIILLLGLLALNETLRELGFQYALDFPWSPVEE
ncbi:MAG: sulfite exporter TauE/SafE family protein [bacterium]|nr:sulfite exporter TauE/SafE family protein [bacterium]